MYANVLTVDVTVKCGECHRVAVMPTRLGQQATGELGLVVDSLPVPESWSRKQVDRRTWELFCPVCTSEGRP